MISSRQTGWWRRSPDLKPKADEPLMIQLQTASTFLDAGWDFVDETENGTEDTWWILEGQDYPRLWWELVEDYTPAN